MIQKEHLSSRTVSGLRTRYYPKSRIGQGLVSVGPWVDIMLLIIFFVLLLDSKVVLQPGVIVQLPEAPFTEGSRSELIAVVLSAGASQEIVFFDDERFLVRQEEQLRSLGQAFAVRAREYPDAILVIQADRRVPHGTVMNIINLALDVGIKKVNVAERPL